MEKENWRRKQRKKRFTCSVKTSNVPFSSSLFATLLPIDIFCSGLFGMGFITWGSMLHTCLVEEDEREKGNQLWYIFCSLCFPPFFVANSIRSFRWGIFSIPFDHHRPFVGRFRHLRDRRPSPVTAAESGKWKCIKSKCRHFLFQGRRRRATTPNIPDCHLERRRHSANIALSLLSTESCLSNSKLCCKTHSQIG